MPDCCGPDVDAPAAEGRPLVAVVGNPNVGKSTLFNALTGRHHAVGNWGGRTVRRGAAACVLPGVDVDVVDLPGTYSLAASAPEERITRDAVVRRGLPDVPDVVVVVLDAGNLERTLYIAAEVLDTGLPVLVAVTMLDIAATRGLRLDLGTLAVLLGAEVFAVDARTGSGVRDLASAIGRLARGKRGLLSVLG